MPPPLGILLSNLGTPDAPTPAAVRRYLAQFLTDPRVIDIPWLPRQLLVRGIIAPTRAPRSARAYASVWTEDGSPLLVRSRALEAAVAARLSTSHRVALGMRYGNPSMEHAFRTLLEAGCEEIRLVPLYPQEAEATTGSTRVEFERIARRLAPRIRCTVADPFPEDGGFVAAQADLLRPHLGRVPAEGRHLLLSYHGLPERQIRRVHAGCLESRGCCDSLGVGNRHCYRAQCLATSRALAAALGIPAGSCTTAFQSRLGRIPWIGPHTDETARRLAADGIRHLVVATPSFVVDCLETLEEIGHGLRRTFLEAGGESFALAPCVNDHPAWVDSVARWSS